MSASKEKRIRDTVRAEGGSKKEIAAQEKAAKDRKFRRNTIIFIVALVIVVAVSIFITSDMLYTSTTAITIGDTDYSPAEFSYYYRSMYNRTYSELYEQYGDMTSYFLNNQTPLDEQVYVFGDGESTWHDYFYTTAITQITNTTVLYDAAIAAGKSLSDEDAAEIETLLETYEASLEGSDFADLDALLAYNFGKGFDSKTLRALAEKEYIATAYSDELSASFEYTSDELEAYYSEHTDELDFITYHSYYVGTTGSSFSEMDEADCPAAAKAEAEKIADAASGAQFVKNIQNFVSDDLKSSYEDETATKTITQASNIPELLAEWLTDPARVEGDTTVIDNDSGSYALMFISRNDNHYNLVDARHILVMAEADENGAYTDEALDAAKAEAEALLAQWQEDPTEENFAAMANEYSEDGGSNTNGGLYEGIYMDYMVEEFNDFIFAEGRQTGDTGIVYGNNGSYAGYHVIYFQGQGQLFSDFLADDALRGNDYNEVVGGFAENYKLEIGSGMKYVEY